MEPFKPARTNESARREDPPCGLTQHVCLAAAGGLQGQTVGAQQTLSSTNAGGKQQGDSSSL